MNRKLIQMRALDKKLSLIKPLVPIVPTNQSWIRLLRETLGMTGRQLARRLGVSQSRIAYMEQNEENLKLSTLKKVAESMNCMFIPLFVPNDTLEATLQNQAEKKAASILESVNQTMALENQLVSSDEVLSDLIDDLLKNNPKQIWD